jgi:hypothetical protein
MRRIARGKRSIGTRRPRLEPPTRAAVRRTRPSRRRFAPRAYGLDWQPGSARVTLAGRDIGRSSHATTIG